MVQKYQALVYTVCHQLVADRVHERLIFLHHRAEFLCCQRAARPPFRFWMRCSAPPFCL